MKNTRNHSEKPDVRHSPIFSAGFTLIELSMVMAIIGLIIGGVLAGQSLIHAAQLQSVINDADDYKKAVKLFQDKYKALPGDMSNAESFWGPDAGCPATTANVVPKTATCNGNGDGFISISDGNPFVTTGTSGTIMETYRLWQQLADAGFIKGQYTGAGSSRTAYQGADPGMNIPASKITGNGFSLLYTVPAAGGIDLFSANYHHIIMYGVPGQFNLIPSTYGPGLTTADALSIDKKMDDGKPGTGNIMTFPTGTLPNCATGNDPATARYNIAYTGIACSLIFITGF